MTVSTQMKPLSLACLVGLLACSAQAATVTSFAKGLYTSLYGITSDGAALYVTGSTGVLRDFNGNPSSGAVGKLSLSGGAMTTLYSVSNYSSQSGHIVPLQIAADGLGGLLWADPDAGPGTGAAFLKGDTSGTPPSQIFSICCGESVLPGDSVGVAVAAGHLYFSDSTGGRIGVDPSGSSATQLGPTRIPPNFNTAAYAQIAVANGKVFIADSAEIRFGSNSGKQALLDQSAFIASGVRWISTDGSSGFQDLSIGKIDHPRGIVAVGNLLYVTSAKAVWSIDQSTGATQLVVKDKRFKDLQGITWANGALYVADSQTKFGPPVDGLSEATRDKPGRVWKVKP
jgi:hypothetical protein